MNLDVVMTSDPLVGRWFSPGEQTFIKGMFGEKIDFSYASVWNGARKNELRPGAKRFVYWVDVTGDDRITTSDIRSSKRFVAIHYVFEGTRNGMQVNYSYREDFVPDIGSIGFDGAMRTFMHEVVHVWQFQNDIPYGTGDYRYLERIDFESGRWVPFKTWGIEEQARFIQDIWEIKLGNEPKYYLEERGPIEKIAILHSIREEIREYFD